MATNDSSPLPQRVFMTLGSVVLIVAMLQWGQKVLIPVALAMLLAFILSPLVATLQKRGVPRVFAAALTVLLATAVVGGLGWIFTAQLRGLVETLPEHTETIAKKINALQGDGDGPLGKLEKMFEEITRQVKAANPNAPIGEGKEPQPVVVQNEHPVYLSIFPAVAGTVAEVLASVVLVVMLVVFMLIRREDLRFRLIQMVGRGRLTLTTRALDEAAERISAFLVMQLTVNAGFGVVWFLCLAVIGVPFAFLWGVLALVLRFVPYLGTWVSLAFPLVLSVAVSPDWVKPIEVFAVFLALELLTANVLEPLLFSHSTGVSAVALLVAAAFWIWLWGPIGLIMSTPLTVCLIVLGRHVPQLKFFDILLGSEPVMELDVRFYQRLLAQDEDEAAELVEEYLQAEPREKVYDEVLLPALVRMRRDSERGDLGPDEQRFICHMTRDVLEDMEPVLEPDGDETKKVLVIGCPARDESDELALQMFRQLLQSPTCRVEVLSADKLSAEMVRQIKEEKPALVCIAALASGGLAHARYLCKRLRLQVPDAKVLVGRWGQKDNVAKTEERLRAAGADFVAVTLLESRDQAVPLLPVAAAPTAGEPGCRLQTAGR